VKGRQEYELQCDVLVVGTGYAGLAAAIEALSSGAKVIALGRRNPLASNSALGGGTFAFADTPLQRQKGIQDSADLLARDILEANRRTIPEDTVNAATRQSVQLYDWLAEIGAEFYEVMQYPGHSVPRVHLESGMDGANTLNLLLKRAGNKGADVRPGTVAEHLILNEKNEVEGEQAANSGGKTTIKARRATILAAGGFGKNKSMMARYLPDYADMLCVSGAGSTGDGIRMGMEIGADVLNMDAAELYSLGSAKKGLRILGVSEAMSKGAILVNKNGERFTDESKGYGLTAPPVTQQPDAVALLVLDEELLKSVVKLHRNIDKYLNTELIYYGETASELAKRAGVDPDSLQKTAGQFFPSGKLYGTWVRTILIQSMGGLKVNSRAQVIHRHGHPIPRLYAAGDNTPSLGGAATSDNPCPGYLTGTGYLLALASGRIAGQNAAGVATQ